MFYVYFILSVYETNAYHFGRLWKKWIQIPEADHSVHSKVHQLKMKKQMKQASVALTHYDLVTPYGDKDMSRHWLR